MPPISAQPRPVWRRAWAVVAVMLIAPLLLLASATPEVEAQGTIPRGDAQLGAWGPLLPWSFVPIHAAVDGDGNVLTYGRKDMEANSRNEFGVYDPATGLSQWIENPTPSDLFCSFTTQDPTTNSLLILGGDDDNSRNNDYAVRFENGTLSEAGQMNLPRWYPTATTLPDGRVLIQGGTTKEDGEPIITPEIYTPGEGFRLLEGATSELMFGAYGWYYPRTWVTPSGEIFGIADGRTYIIDVEGDGAIRGAGGTGRFGATAFGHQVAYVTYDIGKALMIGGGGDRTSAAAVVDLTANTPTVRPVNGSQFGRSWANATVLPTGEVFVNGGSAHDRSDAQAAENQASLTPEMWNPDTQTWRPMARGFESRLYHSVQVLLPDATVLTGGGGLPGVVDHRNARIFYPGYLYNSDGSPAARPSITSAPDKIAWGATSTATVTSAIDELVLIRNGASTHATNTQLFVPLEFTQSGSTVTFENPANANIAQPGDYMLFAIDRSGVPSEAAIVSVGGEQDGGDGEEDSSFFMTNTRVAESAGEAFVTIYRNGSTSDRVEMNFATSADTAEPGEDFYGTFETVIFEPGRVSATVPVEILDDDIAEATEYLNVRIWGDGLEFTQNRARIEISDDDGDGQESIVEIWTNDGDEGGEANLVVLRSGNVDQPLSLKVATVPGTGPDSATQGEDYFGFSQWIQLAPGEDGTAISIPLLDDDEPEPLETLDVRIYNADTATIQRSHGTIIIYDDD